MIFLQRVAQAFASQGLLANMAPALTARPGQVQMAVEVARTIEDGGVLAVEAGTGVGKTYAYLVPSLLSGKRTLVSTATKNLQDQLFYRDIPRLLAALAIPLRVALLKGRSSYVCLQRLAQAGELLGDQASSMRADLAKVEIWATATRSGDLSELGMVEDNAPVLPLVTSTRDNCLGSDCPKAASCHVNLARREAMAADVVVINHHLFFADVQVRESGVAELLPTVSTVVFDEAHQLNDVGVTFMAQEWSTRQVDMLCRELERCGPLLALGASQWHSVVFELVHALAALRQCVGQSEEGRRSWYAQVPQGVDAVQWGPCLDGLRLALQATTELVAQVQDQDPVLRALHQRVQGLLQSVSLFAASAEPGTVRWLEAGREVRLLQSPLHIGPMMEAMLQPPAGVAMSRSWIFTSATLGHDATLAWFTASCGLTNARVLKIDSPFDYATQAALYVPSDFPKPSDAAHSETVAHLSAQGIDILGGRTLVLTTTLRAMRSIGQALARRFGPGGAVAVLVQGTMSKRELVEQFCRAPLPGQRGCVLVASASFWEGVDVPGDALQLVVIDKLPFSPPDDPLVQARARALELAGKSPFAHLHVPQAALALKQGAGRLIRSETDRGVLLICDCRLVQNGYGRKILSALPPMQRLLDHDQFIAAVQDLTKTSTRSLPAC